jgi:type IV secretory pathway protease TraF
VAAHVLVLDQQASAFQQQVVIVQQGVAALFVLVGRGHFGQVVPLLQELGVIPGQQVIQGQVLVDHRPQHLGHGLFPGKRPGELFKA